MLLVGSVVVSVAWLSGFWVVETVAWFGDQCDKETVIFPGDYGALCVCVQLILWETGPKQGD